MQDKIIFISKDALRKGALSFYGNKYWKTKNIDELANKGTVYEKYYTAGGSTAMAFTAMATGQYLFASGRKLYDGNEEAVEGNNLFDRLHDAGYDVHIAWDKSYTTFAEKHFKCEGKHTTIHSLDRIIPAPSPHISGQFDDLTFLDDETEKGMELVRDLFSKIKAIQGKAFLWFHLPHVFRGRNAYDSDMDVFDNIIGLARDMFGDDSIYVSADHGQMNGSKGKFSYGYDVDNGVMQIPLITPRVDGKSIIDFPVSNTQLAAIFGLEPLVPQDFVYCETAYYAQPARKMAIVHGDFKLIYDKLEDHFYLYDMIWDPEEKLNLYYPEFYDTDRHCWYSLNQRFFYPHWEKAMEEREILMKQYQKVWHNGTFTEELKQRAIHKARILYIKMKGTKPGKIVNIGK